MHSVERINPFPTISHQRHGFALEDDNTDSGTQGGTTVKPEDTETEEYTYILNTSKKRIHKPDCSSVAQMAEKNKQGTNKTLEELIEEGYTSCGTCKP